MPNPGARIDQMVELLENGLINQEQVNELVGLSAQIQQAAQDAITYGEAYLQVPRTMSIPPDSSVGIVEYSGNPPIAPIQVTNSYNIEPTYVDHTATQGYVVSEAISYNGETLHNTIQKMMQRIEKLEKENKELKQLYDLTIDKELERIANESDNNNV